jgi:hypothetical protein
MKNNVFVKKYNPDVESKTTEILNLRNTTEFTPTNVIYNPITGIVPDKITDIKDLCLNDKNIPKQNINTLISNKEQERKTQDDLYKPVNTKITPQEVNNNISTFEDLKTNSQIKSTNTTTNNTNDILDNLKKLGIIR